MKQLGDFTGLAENYSRYRPAYSESILTALLTLCSKPVTQLDVVDVGAGTGILTRMLAARGCRTVTAVEPNADMRKYGKADSQKTTIDWLAGSAEETGLPDHSMDWLSMASSFHWADFDRAVAEFARVLRAEGRFVALWNPRLIEANPLLVEIEQRLEGMVPELKRVSSGRSGITDTLTDRLFQCRHFTDIIYMEGRHSVRQTPEHYLGVWWSVNDIRVQAGEQRFAEFMDYVEKTVSGLPYIETTYLTRAWSALKV